MLKQLFLDTIYKPQLAAGQILSLRLPAGTIWQGLALASVLNTLVFFITIILFPPLDGLSVMIGSPILMAAVLFVVMTVGAMSLFLAGRFLSGAAEFNDILALITWLQFMRLAVQVGGFFLMFLVPGLANFAMFLAGLYGIWIMLNFLNEAQGFDSLGKSFGNLFLSFVALTMFLFVLLNLFGLSAIE